jgi:branched-chain amino acid aminotransferase
MKSTVYLNGRFLPYDKACIPLATHALHYGSGCFEGIRAYWSQKKEKLFIFRLKDHFLRLKKSGERLYMQLPSTVDELCRITVSLIKKNHYRQGIYIRPLVYKASETVTSFNLKKLVDGFAIYTVPLGHYLNVAKGITAITSSWLRVDGRMIPPSAKPTGLYLNTSLAKTEAEEKGVSEAILLNSDDSVSEGSAENIFLVKNGALITPSPKENILLGITRDTIIQLGQKELGLKVEERKVMKKELFEAQEIFLTGTGAEVTPVTEIDRQKINGGKIGPSTKKLQSLYFQIVHGENEKYNRWLTAI